jgi:hypothetical protein
MNAFTLTYGCQTSRIERENPGFKKLLPTPELTLDGRRFLPDSRNLQVFGQNFSDFPLFSTKYLILLSPILKIFPNWDLSEDLKVLISITRLWNNIFWRIWVISSNVFAFLISRILEKTSRFWLILLKFSA